MEGSKTNFNTSHVNVNRAVTIAAKNETEFQYISC